MTNAVSTEYGEINALAFARAVVCIRSMPRELIASAAVCWGDGTPAANVWTDMVKPNVDKTAMTGRNFSITSTFPRHAAVFSADWQCRFASQRRLAIHKKQSLRRRHNQSQIAN